MELKDRGIRVNTITPGPCDTPLIDAEVNSPEEAAAVRAKHAVNIPLGRMVGAARGDRRRDAVSGL
jgi:NAD(P)-dependent dehydrogenase (short-subunit alcohol dehydrogenase family)